MQSFLLAAGSMGGLNWTFRTGLWLGRGPSPVDAMFHLQLGGARAGRACQSPARIWLRQGEETVMNGIATCCVGTRSRMGGAGSATT